MKTVFPESVVSVLVKPELTELLSTVSDLDVVLGEPGSPSRPWWWRAIRLAARFRAGRFQIAIVSNPRKDLHVAVWLAGIPVRIGYDRKWPWTLTHRVEDHKALGERHEVEYNLELLTALGIPVPATPTLHLQIRRHEEDAVAQLVEGWSLSDTKSFVAVHPWTSNPKKQWPLTQFQQVVARLVEDRKAQVVVVGSQDAGAGSESVRWHPHAVNVVGKTTLPQLAALFRRVRVLLSNDSGPVHLAAAVGTPVVALFGTDDPGSHPTRWGPWGAGHTVIHKPLVQIAVEEVVTAVTRYLT